MKLVVFGLAISSAWGNGHATLWRGLARALGRMGHQLVFFERDRPFYAAHRDLQALPGLELVIYPDWAAVEPRARAELGSADAALITSYCPDAEDATAALLDTPVRVRGYYDLDAPVTLGLLDQGQPVPWLPRAGLSPFHLVLSFTGGPSLAQLRGRLGARRVAALYGGVDPELHRPAPPHPELQADLSYLGTYAADRQAALEALLMAPARQRPQRRFVIAGAQYPADLPLPPAGNVRLLPHVPPPEHPAFYGSSPLTLNITRGAMAALGYCPSARLFEAAACGVAVLSDRWAGLDQFFTPGEEILVADDAGQALAALDLPAERKSAVAARARRRALAEHTTEHRAAQLVDLLARAA